MRLPLPRFRAHRRARAAAALPVDRIGHALDRSQLLAELEVSVPAPERIVAWDSAVRTPLGGRG